MSHNSLAQVSTFVCSTRKWNCCSLFSFFFFLVSCFLSNQFWFDWLEKASHEPKKGRCSSIDWSYINPPACPDSDPLIQRVARFDLNSTRKLETTRQDKMAVWFLFLFLFFIQGQTPLHAGSERKAITVSSQVNSVNQPTEHFNAFNQIGYQCGPCGFSFVLITFVTVRKTKAKSAELVQWRWKEREGIKQNV